jgi:hypothetical protein
VDGEGALAERPLGAAYLDIVGTAGRVRKT